MWLRDLVHVARDARDVPQVRGLIVDITDRKRAEQALKRSERQYSDAFRREREATLRLRALDDMKNTFLEAVSHDLRTPLRHIASFADLLRRDLGALEPPPAVVRRVGIIQDSARRMDHLISGLLEFARTVMPAFATAPEG